MDKSGAGTVFIVDRDAARTIAARRRWQAISCLLGIGAVALAWYGLHQRAAGNFKNFNQLVLATAVVSILFIEALLASRKSARERVSRVRLEGDALVLHPVFSHAWTIPYQDIVAILVRYRGSYSHYDHMSLVLTVKGGASVAMGHCQGELLDGLATELRRRCRECGGIPKGSVALDRRFRLGQRRRVGRRATFVLALAALALLAQVVLIERDRALDRRLEQEGGVTEARVASILHRRDHVGVTYVFIAGKQGVRRGNARFARDAVDFQQRMVMIPIRYLVEDPNVNRPIGALPRHSPSLRVIAWTGLLVLVLCLLVVTRGVDMIMFRGRYRFVPRNRLVEDCLFGNDSGVE